MDAAENPAVAKDQAPAKPQPLAPASVTLGVNAREATMLIVTCNGAPIRPPGRLPPTADSFTRATWMAEIDEHGRGRSLGPWHWEAIRRGHAASVLEAQAA